MQSIRSVQIMVQIQIGGKSLSTMITFHKNTIFLSKPEQRMPKYILPFFMKKIREFQSKMSVRIMEEDLTPTLKFLMDGSKSDRA